MIWVAAGIAALLLAGVIVFVAWFPNPRLARVFGFMLPWVLMPGTCVRGDAGLIGEGPPPEAYEACMLWFGPTTEIDPDAILISILVGGCAIAWTAGRLATRARRNA